MAGPVGASQDAKAVNTALALSGVAVVIWVVLMALAVDGPIWLLVAAFGAAGVVMAWKSAGGRPTGRALAAAVVGALAVASVIGWLIIAAATGNL